MFTGPSCRISSSICFWAQLSCRKGFLQRQANNSISSGTIQPKMPKNLPLTSLCSACLRRLYSLSSKEARNVMLGGSPNPFQYTFCPGWVSRYKAKYSCSSACLDKNCRSILNPIIACSRIINPAPYIFSKTPLP